jgi:hypothetical protein
MTNATRLAEKEISGHPFEILDGKEGSFLQS